MKKGIILTILASLMLGLGGCRPEGDCVVKGTVKGVRNGTRVVLQNEWDHFKVVGTGRVRNGAFEIRPEISGPAHVYLYTHNEIQLKDFFLEPGTIRVEATAEDESLLFTGASGTPVNDLYGKYRSLRGTGQDSAALAFRDSVMAQEAAGPLALLFATNGESSAKGLAALDKLVPELAALPYVAELREELTRRVRTEPREEGSDFIPVFIDMEYPDAEGKPVRLGEVVNDSANRYVLLDFWATWCGPCREAIPKLRELYAKYHGKGLEIYSVSEDGDAENWKSFIKENGMTWINVRDTECGRKNSKMWHAYALHGIPTVLLIDGNSGEIIARDNLPGLDGLLAEKLQ